MHLQLAMPGSHGFHKDYAYSDAQVAWNAWNAACDWQKVQEDKEPYLWFDPDTYQISRFKPSRSTYIPLYEH